MCAIAGEIALTPDGRVRLDAVAPMTGVLRHRGPDQWGYWVPPDRSVLLLNARLAIVDVARGRQPLANEDGTVWVTFNGELYGFERLIADLSRRGHRFRTRTDTEVIVHLYEEYGAGFVDHLRGEFAIALHDLRQRTTLLVRDRFGVKPLFYARTARTLVFASEMKGLFAHPDVTPRLNRDQILHMIGSVFLPGQSLFHDVFQVEPGTLLRVRDGGVDRIRYWAPAFDDRDGDAPADDDREVVAEFASRFEEAVRLRLHGDVETALYLSGGIDSAALTRVVSAAGRPVKAFTVGFAGPDYDETARASEVAARCGVEHHVVRVGPGDLAQPFVDAVWHAEAPVINAHAAAKFVLSRLAARHVKAVMTGEGADETLVGYAQFRHQQLLDHLRRHPGDPEATSALRALLAETGTLTGTIPIDRYHDADRVIRLFGCYPYPAAKCAYYQSRLRLVLAAPLRRRLPALDSLDSLARVIDRDALAGLPAVAASQYVLCKTELPAYVLSTLGDRMEMAHGIEGRTPFLDHPLVEFVNRLPLRYKLRNGVSKWVLREAMRGPLGEAAATPKRPFMAPSLSTLGLDRRHGVLEPYFDRALIEEAGIFNPSTVRLLWLGARRLPRGTRAQSVCEAAIVLALSVHVLYDLYGRRFGEYADRYRVPGGLDLAAGAVATAPAP